MNSDTHSHHPSHTSGSTADTAKAEAQSMRDDAERAVKDTGQAIADEARHRADSAKEGVAAEISSVSSALRKASDELRGGSPQERTFAAAASALADVSETVKDKDLGELVNDLSGFARRNPLAFLGGAALLGFAGVRMAKASHRARIEDDSRERADAYGTTTDSRMQGAAPPPTPPGSRTTATPQPVHTPTGGTS